MNKLIIELIKISKQVLAEYNKPTPWMECVTMAKFEEAVERVEEMICEEIEDEK